MKEELDKLGIHASVRVVQETTSPWRRELTKRAKATVRFETPPGKQLQIDFGELKVCIGGEGIKIHFFVATLAFSRRIYVRAFVQETQAEWLQGLESAFYHFRGITREVLLDNPKACVIFHNSKTGEVLFNKTFLAFCHYWGIRPRACAPYRARTKGKDERAVGFFKRNGIAGRSFESFAHLESHLEEWMRTVDKRIHGTTNEQPILRFEREDLVPLSGRPPFIQSRELRRKVHTDACVEVECNRYSVPWKHIGQTVTVRFVEQDLIILLGAQELARHPQYFGRHQTRIDPHHLQRYCGGSSSPSWRA